MTKPFDPVDSFAGFLYKVAHTMSEWRLDEKENVRGKGELLCAVAHVRLAAEHFLKANGRRALAS